MREQTVTHLGLEFQVGWDPRRKSWTVLHSGTHMAIVRADCADLDQAVLWVENSLKRFKTRTKLDERIAMMRNRVSRTIIKEDKLLSNNGSTDTSPRSLTEGTGIMALSFLQGRKLGSQPARVPARGSDPLGLAKDRVIASIEQQKRLVSLLLEGEALPKRDGKRTVVWFYKDFTGAYWSTLRYGQFVIPLDEGNTAIEVGKLSDLIPFYDQVITAIRAGELDEVLRKLRTKRGGRTRAAAPTPAPAAPAVESSDGTEQPAAPAAPASSSSTTRGARGRRGTGAGDD